MNFFNYVSASITKYLKVKTIIIAKCEDSFVVNTSRLHELTRREKLYFMKEWFLGLIFAKEETYIVIVKLY